MRTLAFVLLAGFCGCHLVFPHHGRPLDGGPVDVPPLREVARELPPPVDGGALERPRPDQIVLPAPRSWVWENPHPTWSRLTGVFAAPAGDKVFAVGLRGTILVYDIASMTLGQPPLPATGAEDPRADLFAVWGRSSNEVYAVGEKLILEYDGTLWKRGAVGASLRGISGSSTKLFAVGEAGGKGIIVSGKPGALAEQPVDEPLRAVWVSTDGKAHVVGSYESSSTCPCVFDGGKLTSLVKPEIKTGYTIHANAIWGRTLSPELYLGGSYSSSGFVIEQIGGVWKSAPTVISGQGAASVNGIWGSPNATVLVGQGTSLRVFSSGSWDDPQKSNPWGGFSGVPLTAVSGFSPGPQLFVVGEYGLFATGTIQGGFVSVKGSESVRANLLSVWSSPSETIAVGHETLLRRDPNGAWPNQEPTGLPKGTVTAVWGREKEVYLALTKPMAFASTIFRWDLSTKIAKELTLPTGVPSERISAIWGDSDPAGLVYFVGGSETLFVHDPAAPDLKRTHQSVGGAALVGIWGWPESSPQTLVAVSATTIVTLDGKGTFLGKEPTNWIANGVWGSSANDLTIVSEQGIHRRQAAGSWSADAARGACSSIWGAGPSEVYVLCDQGLVRWDGSSWRDEPLPDPPAGKLGELAGKLFGSSLGASRATLTIVGRGGAILRSP